MAAAAPSADDLLPCQCHCSNIGIMQLFHELKQKYPAVPDRVVSECIRQNCHDKPACELLLRRENHGYLMHSYPVSLKMSSGPGEPEGVSPTCRQQCERCVTRGHDPATHVRDAVDATPSYNHPRMQSEFYSTIRETQVLQNSGSTKNMNRSLIRDTVIEGGDMIIPGVFNLNDAKRCLKTGAMTGTQWFAQGSTTQFLPSASEYSLHDLPIGDTNFRYSPSNTRLPTRLVGGDGSNGQFTACNHQRMQTTAGATNNASQFQCVESQSVNSSHSQFYAQFDDNSNRHVKTSVSNSSQCNQQRQTDAGAAAAATTHSLASRRSLSVQSSTTYHNQCNRPCSLDVTPIAMLDQPHPRSAPELPSDFDPFTPMSPSRSSDFNTPSTPTTPSDSYPLNVGRNGDACNTFSPSIPRTVENNLNCPRGKSDGDCRVVNEVMNVESASRVGAGDVYHRARSALNVDPAPHYASRNYWGGGGGTVALPSQQPRSYTSVNLTLRPPSAQPLPPIEIASAGSSLTYSTSSYDPYQGFQSQLQIRIGPGGVGSVSALRTRAPEARPRSCYETALKASEDHLQRAESLPDVTSNSLVSEDFSTSEESLRQQMNALGINQLHSATQALLLQQMKRKDRLRRELKREKQKLREMHREVKGRAEDLAQRQLRQRAANIAACLPVDTTVLHKVQCLRQEIQYLQTECKKMTTEVDMSSDNRVPLGETDEAFYENIYTGQHCVLNRHPNMNSTQRRDVRHIQPPSSPLEALDSDGPNWTCSECTFRNHPLLDKCEQCEMPRIILGTDVVPNSNPSIDCYCHPLDTDGKMSIPNPLRPFPHMITERNDSLRQAHNS